MKELCFDISTWQGGIDYNEIKKRTNYCILRAGFGDFGSGIKDNQFENHYENLKDINLGAYWYSDARNMEEAKSEAYKFLQYVNGKKFTLPLFLDIEDATQRNLGRDTLNSIITAFGEVIEEAGYYFAVYTNLDWYRNVISGSELNKKFDWWIACWSDTAPSGVNYGVWQFTSDYLINNERLDANYVFVNYPDVIRKAGLNHLEVIPTPTPTPSPTPSFDLLDLVKRTIRGDFGNGDERKEALGDKYDEVQRQVNLNYENGTTDWDNIRIY